MHKTQKKFVFLFGFQGHFAQFLEQRSQKFHQRIIEEYWPGIIPLEEKEEIEEPGAPLMMIKSLQRWTKRWTLGCEKFLPGPAGLLLSKTGPPFSPSLYSVVYKQRQQSNLYPEEQSFQWLDQTAVKTVKAPDQTARFGTSQYKIQLRFGLKPRF